MFDCTSNSLRDHSLSWTRPRAIAARTEPRFIEPEPRRKLRRTNNLDFIEIPRERGGRVHFTEEQLDARRPHG